MDRVLGCATTIVDETPLFELAHARIIVCVTAQQAGSERGAHSCATTIVDETPLFEPALGRAHARIIVCVTHSKQDRKEERTHRHSLMRTITQRNSTTLCTLHARCVQFPTLVDGQPRPKISYFLFRPSVLLFIYIPDRVRSNFFFLFPTVFLSLGGEEKWRRGGD